MKERRKKIALWLLFAAPRMPMYAWTSSICADSICPADFILSTVAV